MERLTEKVFVVPEGQWKVLNDEEYKKYKYVVDRPKYADLYSRLGMIENLLCGDKREYSIDRLRELIEADREGRCVVLPVKPGETVRFNGNPISKPEVVDAICIYANGRITYNFHTTGMKTTYVDEWSEDDADKYCPVSDEMKESENDG